MDYERAYKAVLKTATQWIKDGCTDKEKICLECVFPELRESEDERIRKWLIDYFGSIKKTVWIHRDITCEQILAYLEKQKEQKPIGTDFRTAVKNLMNLHKIKNEFTEEDYDFQAKELLKLVKQKPAWSEEDQLNLNWVIAILNGEPCDLDIQLESLISWLKSLRPSWKPSEEQLNALDFAITYFMHETNYKNPTELRELYDDLLKLK